MIVTPLPPPLIWGPSPSKGPPTVKNGKKWNVPGVQLRPEAALHGPAHTIAFHPPSS